MQYKDLAIGEYFMIDYINDAFYRKCYDGSGHYHNAVYINRGDGHWGLSKIVPSQRVIPCDEKGKNLLKSFAEIEVNKYFTDCNSEGYVWFKCANGVIYISHRAVDICSKSFFTDKQKLFVVVDKPDWVKFPD